MNNTIVAISTATGAGGIGIVRMSGDNCFNILKKYLYLLIRNLIGII